MQLVLASNNAKKLAELQHMLVDLPLQLVAQSTLGIGEAEEPHITFIENALLKARHAAAASGCAAMADDSGVCVNALGGAPGVISAHYAGEVVFNGEREARRRLQGAANNALLLDKLSGSADRSAYFVSTLVAIRHAQDPEPLVAVGRWPGVILPAPQGDQGFGYDPLMFIAEHNMTVAQMTPALKNQVSHRARAVQQMQTLLREVWRL